MGSMVGKMRHKIWVISTDRKDHRLLAMINDQGFDDPSKDMLLISQQTKTFKMLAR